MAGTDGEEKSCGTADAPGLGRKRPRGNRRRGPRSGRGRGWYPQPMPHDDQPTIRYQKMILVENTNKLDFFNSYFF